MAYKIVWSSGGETAERYSTKELARRVLKGSRYKGRVVKVSLGDAGRTQPSYEFKYGDKKTKHYPKGKKLHWVKRKTKGGDVYTTHVKRT